MASLPCIALLTILLAVNTSARILDECGIANELNAQGFPRDQLNDCEYNWEMANVEENAFWDGRNLEMEKPKQIS